MFRKFASVSGFTLLSRLTGFLRDVTIASILGSGLAADAYFVAQRLPNHFRAIFGEGAFNSAFVPSYAREISEAGHSAAVLFAGRILTLLTAVLVPLCAFAMWQMPLVIDLLAPGFVDEPEKYKLAVMLTRITFPYLLLISIVTLFSGILNAHNRFAIAAGAPVLLNLAILTALYLAFLFPSAAHAAAWGITVSGILQLVLVGYEAYKIKLLPRFEAPILTPAMGRFFRALGPAVIGSAGVQIAIFADTIIASLLPTGSVSAISYADRLYQLPVGLIGIAAGTVLLPEMSKHLANQAHEKAHSAQSRSISLSLMLAAPFLIAFLMIPSEIMQGVFMRGHFTIVDANASASVLAAYAVGILPIVMIRSILNRNWGMDQWRNSCLFGGPERLDGVRSRVFPDRYGGRNRLRYFGCSDTLSYRTRGNTDPFIRRLSACAQGHRSGYSRGHAIRVDRVCRFESKPLGILT